MQKWSLPNSILKVLYPNPAPSKFSTKTTVSSRFNIRNLLRLPSFASSGKVNVSSSDNIGSNFQPHCRVNWASPL